MTEAINVSRIAPEEISRLHMERVRRMLIDYLAIADLTGQMRVSRVCPGHIGTCNVAPTPQDSWQISLLLGGKPRDASMATLENAGFRNANEDVATIRYGFEGNFYSIFQHQILPGAFDVTKFEFESHADAVALVFRIIANVNFAEGTCKFVQKAKPKTFRRHWYDSLVLRRTIYNKRHTGYWDESFAIVSYDGLKVVVPLTKDARRETFKHFFNELKINRLLGGFVIPENDWLRHVHELRDAVRGGILYLDSIYG